MGAKIAVITSAFLKGYIRDVLSLLEPPVAGEFEVYCYTDYKSLPGLYESLPKNIKGIVTSGSFPCRVLELAFPETKRIVKAFNNDDAGICKMFLELLDKDRAFDFDRVYVDVFDIAGIERGQYKEYLLGSRQVSLADLQHECISRKSMQELLESEERFAAKHIELWNGKKTDVSITRFSSIMGRLARAGVNALFAYPDKFYTRDILLSCLQAVAINEFSGNLAASIFVTVKPGKDEKAAQKKMKRLQQALKCFGTRAGFNYELKQSRAGFEIITNKEAVKSLTGNFTLCKMRGFLVDGGLDVYAGYGIGNSLPQARINAVDAHSLVSGLPCPASALIDENDRVVSPLDAEKQLVFSRSHSDAVKELSKLSGLSCMTIQKIVSAAKALPADGITAELLSYNLSITRRSANRFLSALKLSGLAHVVEQMQSTSKGRPKYVYKINL
ncbi:MAG: hypothetical protein FWG66_09845 [Spirochaetes bacterium]|nr:hypothetical protein [Spirochaetota bacterium]